ncbi:MAG: hypothetical protein WBB45_21140 [Cyclobacteriaceae bacterium]
MRTTGSDFFKNLLAPEVAVEQRLTYTGNQAGTLLRTIADKYGMSMEGHLAGQWKLKFAGNPVVGLSQTKVVLGLTPDYESYQRLHSYITVRLSGQGCMSVTSHERIIAGTPSEQKVYRAVLQSRLNRFVAFLKAEMATA